MIPVGVVEEDAPPLDSTAYDVVQCTRCINARLSCHEKDYGTKGERGNA
jgi:hypothetical protein